MTFTELNRNIGSNISWFMKKVNDGTSTPYDMAKLCGLGDKYLKGERVNEMKNTEQRVKEILNEEFGYGIKEEIKIEKDLEGRPVLSEADEEETTEQENTDQDNSEESNDTETKENDNESETEDANETEDDNSEEEENKEEEPKDDKEKEEEEKGPLKDGETTHLESFEELFNETDVKIKIQKQGIGPEPSPMFGQSQAKHNKYKISLTNDKGGDISWTYWDSEKNTEDGTVPDSETVMKDFGLKLEAAVVGISFEKFKEDFGYDQIDNSLAQKQYEGLRKMKDNIKKIFPDQHNVYQLIQIAKKS